MNIEQLIKSNNSTISTVLILSTDRRLASDYCLRDRVWFVNWTLSIVCMIICRNFNQNVSIQSKIKQKPFDNNSHMSYGRRRMQCISHIFNLQTLSMKSELERLNDEWQSLLYLSRQSLVYTFVLRFVPKWNRLSVENVWCTLVQYTWYMEHSPEIGRDTFNDDPLVVSLSVRLIPMQPPMFYSVAFFFIDIFIIYLFLFAVWLNLISIVAHVNSSSVHKPTQCRQNTCGMSAHTHTHTYAYDLHFRWLCDCRMFTSSSFLSIIFIRFSQYRFVVMFELLTLIMIIIYNLFSVSPNFFHATRHVDSRFFFFSFFDNNYDALRSLI